MGVESPAAVGCAVREPVQAKENSRTEGQQAAAGVRDDSPPLAHSGLVCYGKEEGWQEAHSGSGALPALFLLGMF